jgi:polyisoprenoid-binding protein YceI
MKKLKNIGLSLAALAIVAIVSGYTFSTSNNGKSNDFSVINPAKNHIMNMFVTHGHCSTPFTGNVQNLNVSFEKREDKGNPIEGMKLSFEVDPNTFNVCSGDDLTARIKTPGLFINDKKENITFRSKNIYTMGIDWYQVNGIMTIKGIEHDVKFFVTGIRDPKASMSSVLILEGQIDLLDWGIDYDLIVNGKSDPHPTKWMHMNMKIVL